MFIAPATQIASSVCYRIFFFGMILGVVLFSKMPLLPIGLFAVLTFFKIITLTVELDTSSRAHVCSWRADRGIGPSPHLSFLIPIIGTKTGSFAGWP
jgi:Zn-dependent membrane protease YugP